SNAVGETYWPEKSEALSNGIFQSSDVAELRDGKVFLRGRAGDLINVAGRKILPEIIEMELRVHPQVRECLVLGLPSLEEERAEMIAAVVAASASETELRN